MSSERQYWLHRIANCVELSVPLLKEHKLLSYGWAGIGVEKRPAEFCKTKKQLRAEFNDRYGKWCRSGNYLWNFLSKMRQGDYVVVPTWGKFHIYEIADNDPFAVCEFPLEILSKLRDWNGGTIIQNAGKYLEQEKPNDNAKYDLGFFRRVNEICRDIPRAGYADGLLTPRMKYRGSNINCNNIRDSIDKAIDSFKDKKPIDVYGVIVDSVKENILEILKRELNPNDLEKLVAWYFKKLDAKVEIPAKNERDKVGDADVQATFESIKTIFYVQVKKHDGETDKWAVEQIEKYKEHKAETNDDGYAKIPWVISTAKKFSTECVNNALEHGIRLINGTEFAEMLLDVGFSDMTDFDRQG